MTKIKISIIIVNFNTYKFLHRCLDSIYKNLSNLNYEIIIIDNASNNDWAKLLKRSYPKIHLFINKKNVGFAKANNSAIQKAKGDYILLINPDTLITKNTINEMISFMEQNSDVGVSSPRVELPGGELDDACHRGFPTPWNAFCQFSGLAKIFPFSQLFNGYHLGYKNMNKIHEIDSCIGAFMLIRRKAGAAVGWFDEDYFWYGEDLDFCYRIKKSGWKVMYLPKVKILHYKGIASGIKKHSQGVSSATKETKLMATKARFEVMRIFYQKHYQKIYPRWLTEFVMVSIKLKEYFSLLKYNKNLKAVLRFNF